MRRPPTLGRALDELRRNTSEITDDVHRLSHRLHSSTLDYLGLVPGAAEARRRVLRAATTSPITFAHASLPAPLPSEVALCLFRVAEESLTNIAKHSQRPFGAGSTSPARPTASTSRSKMPARDSTRRVSSSKAGLGFVSMQERLRVLHGTIRVDSAPSRGTRIDAWVPPTSLAATARNDAIAERSAVRAARRAKR